MKIRWTALAIAGAAAASCASTPETAPAAPRAAAGGDIAIGAIADAALPKGECGMILWTLEAERPAPVFRLIVGKGAEMSVNGESLRLPLAEADGASGFGVFERQRFAADGVVATATVRFGMGFDGGSYVERGLLTVESPDGWRTVVPAAGIAGCRAR
jgi:hypothetical protein